MVTSIDKEAAWAWAAGLFEGEGYIGNHKYERKAGGGGWSRTLVLAMTDRDVVERFQEVVGTGAIYVQEDRRAETNKPLHRWQTAKWSEVERILNRMLPYFGERRTASAQESLSKPPPGPRTHCFRGHEFTPENTYEWRGHRSCRICTRNRRQAKREEVSHG